MNVDSLAREMAQHAVDRFERHLDNVWPGWLEHQERELEDEFRRLLLEKA